MENSILQDEESFKMMRQQVELTTSNLISKKDMLKSQIELYNGLQGTINSSAEKIMVFLGDGYFAEMNKQDAKNFLARRLGSIEETSKEFESRINQAKDTLNQLIKLENMGKDEEKEKLNEEGIPFMDIQEEIDEDGNILSVKVNNKEFSTDNVILNNNRDKNVYPIENKEDEEKISITSSNNSSEDKIDGKFESKLKSNDLLDKEQDTTEKEVEERNEQLQEMFEDMEIIEEEKDNMIFNKNLDQDTLLNKIDELKISNEDKFRLKELCIQQFNKPEDNKDEKNEGEVISDQVESQLLKNIPNSFKPEIEDILELQILADNFDDSGDEDNKFADDEEWDFDFDEEEEDDDYADELLYGGKTPFISSDKESSGTSANDLLWSQIMKNRRKIDNEKIVDVEAFVEKEDLKTKPILKNKSENKIKKSVSFSNELEINEIENVSQQLKNIIHTNQNFSRFKQQKLQNQISVVTQDHDNTLNHSIIESDNSQKSNPISEFIVERENSDEINNPANVFIEKNLRNNTIDKPLNNSIIEKNLSLALGEIKKNNNNKDLQPSDQLFKKDKTTPKPLSISSTKISQFKKMVAQNPVFSNKPSRISLDQKAKKIEINDPSIIPFEKDKTIDRISLLNESISENENKPVEEAKTKKVSKFKALRINSGDMHTNNNTNKHSDTNYLQFDQDGVIKDNIAAASTNDSNESVSEIIERSGNMSQSSEFKHNNISKFKAARLPKNKSGLNGQTRTEKKPPSATSEILNDAVTPEFAKASLDYTTLQEDLDTMAKAYIMGMYDDDIDTEGPVVDKVEDFEILNEMINSMPSSSTPTNDPRIQEVRNDDKPYDPTLDEIIPLEDLDDEDGPILMDEIVENDFDYADVETPPDAENLDLQDDFLNHEVVTNYQKLRQKIIFQNNESGYKKSAEELEFEPLDDNGNPIRISRFKATKPKFK